MDRKAIAKRLQALAAEDTKRSKAARLRDVLADVEAALAAGVARTRIRQELEAQGLKMTLATFDTTLARLRKKNKLVATPAQAAPDDALAATARDTAAPSTHSPAALDQIIRSTPNLAALAKLAKKRTRK